MSEIKKNVSGRMKQGEKEYVLTPTCLSYVACCKKFQLFVLP